MHLSAKGFAALILSSAAAAAAASRFTAEDLIALPHVGTSVPSPSGKLAFTPVSHGGNQTLYLTDLSSAEPYEQTQLVHGASQAVWLSDRSLAFLEPKTNTLQYITLFDQLAPLALSISSPKTLLTFPTAVGDLQYEPTSRTLAFTAFVWPDGNLHTVAEQDAAYAARGDEALVYDSLFARHWDTWRDPKSSQIFLTTLDRAVREDGEEESFVAGGKFQAPVNSTRFASPSPDALSDYHLTANYIVFSAKNPDINPAWHTKRDIVLIPINGHGNHPRTLTSGGQGATASPKLSPDETRVAWLEMAEDGYEADKNQIVVYDLKKGERSLLATEWDRSPAALSWFSEGDRLLLTASSEAHSQLWSLDVPAHGGKKQKFTKSPKAIYSEHSSSGAFVLPASGKNGKVSSSRILFTRSSLTVPAETFLLNLGDKEASRVTQFSYESLKDKDLSPGSSFYFEGAEGVHIQGWAVLPPGFKKGEAKKWPLAFLIHGGPQGAWEDSWSSRWNPNVFAQGGYIVIAINPTGSTSFGQALTDGIQRNWGGRPYRDLLAGLQHALKLYPEIDPERTTALGASYGGYMVNWIQGHNEAFGFKALVCHDGIFSTTDAYYSTDELYFVERENGHVTPWEDRAIYEQWNPANHVSKWSTPQLVIHGGKDYRLGESHGLSAFTALQRRGVPSRLVFFPNENHWVLNSGNSLRWHKEIFEWLDEWVGHGKKVEEDVSVEAATKQSMVAASPAFIIQREVN